MAKKIEQTKEQQELYTFLQKEIKKANSRIDRIEKLTGSKETWATHKLYDKLDSDMIQAINSSGHISINKNMSLTQLRAVRKSVENFINSKTSTVTGIKQASKNIKSGLKRSLSDEKHEISDEDAEIIFQIMGDINAKDFTARMKDSEFINLISGCLEHRWSEDMFVNQLLDYCNESNNLDLREKAIILYNKYFNF